MHSQAPSRVLLVRIERAYRAFVRRLAESAFSRWGTGYGDRVSELGYSDTVETLVALDLHAPVGFIQFELRASRGELLTIAVAPASRGSGVGRALLEGAIDRLERAGAHQIGLHVATDNAAGRRLFDQCGFCPDDIEKEYRYPGGAAALRLQRRPRTGPLPAAREETA